MHKKKIIPSISFWSQNIYLSYKIEHGSYNTNKIQLYFSDSYKSLSGKENQSQMKYVST